MEKRSCILWVRIKPKNEAFMYKLMAKQGMRKKSDFIDTMFDRWRLTQKPKKNKKRDCKKK